MKKYLYILIILSLIFGCGEDPTRLEENYRRTMIDNLNAIKPLKVDYQWQYKVSYFNENGEKINEANEIYVILRDTIINNHRWYSSEIEGVDLQTNRIDGLHYRKYIDNINFIEWVEVKYPKKDNYTWLCHNSYRSLIKSDTTITVNSHEYSCHFYKDIIFDSENDVWIESKIFYSVGTGMVKAETYRRKDGGSPYLAGISELMKVKF